MLTRRQVAAGDVDTAGQHAPHAVIGHLGRSRGHSANQATHQTATLLQLVLHHAFGDGTGHAAQHHAGHFVLQGTAGHHVHVHHFFQLEVGACGRQRGQQWVGRGLNHGVGNAGSDHATACGHGDGERLGLAGGRITRFHHEQHVRHALAALPGEAGAVVQAAQALFQHAGFGLELNRLAVAGSGQARLAQHFVHEARQVVAQGVLVAILQRQHFGIVQGFDGVAVELLAAGSGALGLGFFFSRQGFLGTEFSNDGFALVRALDVHPGVFKITQGHAVHGQAGGEPHLLVVLTFVVFQAFADEGCAHRAHELGGIGLGSLFPFLDLDVGQQEGVGAVFVAAIHAQQLAPLQVVEQRGLIVLRLGRGFQLGQGSGNAAGAACRLHIAGQLVVALHAGATGQGRAQGQYPQQTGAKVRKSFHFFPSRTMYGMSESPAAPTARYQPKLTSALLRAPKPADKVRVASGER